MLISLCVLGIVVGLASHAAFGQLRFFRGVGEVVQLRTQIGHAGAVAASMLRTVGVGSDILVALDSAIEFRATIGSAFTCTTDSGRVTVPGPAQERGNTLAAFAETPRSGDELFAWASDSVSEGWIALQVGASPFSAATCQRFGSVDGSAIPLREPIFLKAGASLRFTRRWRLSLYRASDDRWYLGAREWNGATGSFNTIQPVAGPLAPHSADPLTSGLTFEYRDDTGLRLAPPAPPARIASVSVTTRSQSLRPVRVAGLSHSARDNYADEHVVTVAFRNRP
jgi:hypothetical protein